MKKDPEYLWERQKGESDEAWEAFCIYLHLTKRRVRTVSEQLSKSRTLISRWKNRWFWDERVRAYDNDVERDEYLEDKKERRKSRKQQAMAGALLVKYGLEVLKRIDPSEASLKDARELVKIGAEIERLARDGLVDDHEAIMDNDGERTDDVVIYVPDNGLGGPQNG